MLSIWQIWKSLFLRYTRKLVESMPNSLSGYNEWKLNDILDNDEIDHCTYFKIVYIFLILINLLANVVYTLLWN